MTKICDECETVAHCTKNGCIPKVSAKDAAMKLALKALECKDGWGSSVRVLKERAVTSLRTALSASKIEGDLMQRFYEGEEAKSLISEAEETITALREVLAEQPAQPSKPLTKDQIAKFYGGDSPIVLQIIRDTEAAHGITGEQA